MASRRSTSSGASSARTHMGRYLRRFFHPVQAFHRGPGDTVGEMEEFTAPLAKAFGRLQRATAWLAQSAMKNPDEAGSRVGRLPPPIRLGRPGLRLGVGQPRSRSTKLEDGSDAFYEAKLATARFFMQRMLPRSSSHFAAIMAGSASMMEFPDEAF